jgi:hypothetical protein
MRNILNDHDSDDLKGSSRQSGIRRLQGIFEAIRNQQSTRDLLDKRNYSNISDALDNQESVDHKESSVQLKIW